VLVEIEADQRTSVRRIGLWLHPFREEAVTAAVAFIEQIAPHGIQCLISPDRYDELQHKLPGIRLGKLSSPEELNVELLVVLGGDGTILTAAEWALPNQIPLLGVNLGHVGFLAELESFQMPTLVQRVVAGDYGIEERLTVMAQVFGSGGNAVGQIFAVNELSVEKAGREKMIDLNVSVDDRPLSRWHCDGLLVSTPSGSTAYAFSAGGPVIWPDVMAIELVPLLAHALFARPLVLSPESVIDIELDGDSYVPGVLVGDGRRDIELLPGFRVRVTRGSVGLKLARMGNQPFTTRLVKKFALPVNGWRNP
jgi:NAD+ kinase